MEVYHYFNNILMKHAKEILRIPDEELAKLDAEK